MLRRGLAQLVLSAVFVSGWMLAKVGRLWPTRQRRPNGCVAATGTFYNHNWFLSHAKPLTCCGRREVVFVVDELVEAPQGVRLVCPPRLARRVLGRALSKLVWLVLVGMQTRPDVFIGYHVFPGAFSALLAARLCGGRAFYQMTGGPIELSGGGWRAENALMRSLGGPSRLVERAMMNFVREFDLVVVRGSRAKRFLEERGLAGRVVVITGSVEFPSAIRPHKNRRFDLVFVGRLTTIKNPRRFVRIVDRVRCTRKDVHAIVVGDGPERARLQRLAHSLGLDGHLTIRGQSNTVMEILQECKVYVLTSRSEGMSISMLEAMACGTPVVVADVGELSDIVFNGVNGWLVRHDDIDGYVQRINDLLTREELCEKIGAAARETAMDVASTLRVADRWRESFKRCGC